MGEAGESAGARTADGAAASLDNLGEAADDAAESAGNMGDKGDGAAQGLQNVAKAGQEAASIALDVSAAFADASTTVLGLGQVANVLAGQQPQATDLLNLLRQQNEQYDEQALRLKQLQAQFPALGEATLPQIAREQELLERNQQRRREQDAERQQQQQRSSSSNTSSSGGGFVPSGKLLVEFADRGVDADALLKDSPAMDRLTREFAKRLEALAQRGASA
jgi:hypothetical protein